MCRKRGRRSSTPDLIIYRTGLLSDVGMYGGEVKTGWESPDPTRRSINLSEEANGRVRRPPTPLPTVTPSVPLCAAQDRCDSWQVLHDSNSPLPSIRQRGW